VCSSDLTGSFLRVIDEVIELHPDFVRLYPALVIEGSGLAELYASGGYCPLSLEKAVVLVAWCTKKLEQAGIPVVRMGLQPSESLANNVIAGPYHPSFGELVRSRIWLTRLRRRLAGLDSDQHLDIRVSHRDVSAVVGIRKRNIVRLEELGFGQRFSIHVDPNQPKGNIEYVVC
jgi:histone acetyltransferase (RNA polymerase elongator complex component)